jgi:hypothetical protein
MGNGGQPEPFLLVLSVGVLRAPNMLGYARER